MKQSMKKLVAGAALVLGAFGAIAAEPITANTKELYKALSLVAREKLAERWVKTQVDDRKNKVRRIYYMSMEFLIGRSLNNAL